MKAEEKEEEEEAESRQCDAVGSGVREKGGVHNIC